MERDSSDDDDDRETLIQQNDIKHHHHGGNHNQNHQPLPTSSPRRSAFDIADDEELGSSRVIDRPFRFRVRFDNFNKRYLFAIFLPLTIVLVYFSVDIRSLFSANLPSLKFDSIADRMRESELRAIYLLKEQQLGLLALWNHTFSSDISGNYSFPSIQSNSSLNSTVVDKKLDSSSALFEDVKSAVLKQISLNKEIQQVLLAPHKSGNLSVETENGGGFGDPFTGYDGCRRVDGRFSERKTLEWKPNSNKFLFAICLSGQMSNHLICLEKHMFFAALLNRVLVIPSHKFDFQYNRVIDIEHINSCTGRKVVVSFEEFSDIKNHRIHIDRFMCYFSLPTPCYMDEDHVKKLKGLGISMGKLQPVWVEDIKKPSPRTVDDVKAKFSSNDDVIIIGDVFYADVEKDWVMQPGGPVAHKCRTLIEPSHLIMVTAQRFIQTFLGKNFIALHFRRHGFLKFCNAKSPSCFYPIPQAADCIKRMVERANAPVIYLSTDAAGSETSLLQSLVVLNGKEVPLVKRPHTDPAEKWDALLYRHKLEGDSQVEAMLDKTICALSNVFIGAPGSTFTDDILRLRKDWGSASLCDEYLCQGETPNFIAEDE